MSATPDRTKPGTSDKPDNVKPDSAKPDGAKPDTAKPGETDGSTTPTPEESTAGEEAAVDGIASAVETVPGVETPLGTDAAPMPQIALVLKAIDQKELREFHAEYSSSTAVQRTYRPQGFFGLSPAVLARLPAGAFIEVDTDDEFWRMYEVNVHGPSATDYGTMGLRSAAVQIDYNAADRRRRVTRTLEFIKGMDSGGASKPFSTPMAPGVYHYDTTVTYTFDDSWTGDPRPRSVNVPSSTLRTVYAIPLQELT